MSQQIFGSERVIIPKSYPYYLFLGNQQLRHTRVNQNDILLFHIMYHAIKGSHLYHLSTGKNTRSCM